MATIEVLPGTTDSETSPQSYQQVASFGSVTVVRAVDGEIVMVTSLVERYHRANVHPTVLHGHDIDWEPVEVGEQFVCDMQISRFETAVDFTEACEVLAADGHALADIWCACALDWRLKGRPGWSFIVPGSTKKRVVAPRLGRQQQVTVKAESALHFTLNPNGERAVDFAPTHVALPPMTCYLSYKAIK